jgi:hypothetical protein
MNWDYIQHCTENPWKIHHLARLKHHKCSRRQAQILRQCRTRVPPRRLKWVSSRKLGISS